MRRFHVRVYPAPLPGFEVPGLREQPVYIRRDETDLANILAAKLREHGVEAVPADDLPPDARQIVFLGIAHSRKDRDRALRINKEGFLAAHRAAATMEQQGGLFLMVQGTGGDFGISGEAGERVWSSGLSALAKTAAKEWPSAVVKALDVDADAGLEQIADWISKELIAGGLEKEVGYLPDHTRVAVGMGLSPQVETEQQGLSAGEVVLVSGGARGVTAGSLIELARKLPLRFVLLGRSSIDVSLEGLTGEEDEQQLSKLLFERARQNGEAISPMELKRRVRQIISAREVRQTVEQLERLGSEVRYLAIDITDVQSLQSALEPILEQWGPVRGIVHGAGVLADKRIKDKKEEQFEQVFATKVAGLQTLLEVAGGDGLKMIALFSSVAAREGNVGQCDYAMANEILNRVARQLKRQYPQVWVKSLNWGPWEGGMVTPALKKHFEAQGISLIPQLAGARLFADEMTSVNPDEVEIVVGGVNAETPSLISNQARSFKVETEVSVAGHPFLEDHRINGYAVVPIVWVQEWMYRLAKSLRPDLTVAGVVNLGVMKGIRIHEDDKDSLRITFKGTESYDGETGAIRVSLSVEDTATGTLYYTGDAILEDPDHTRAAVPQAPADHAEAQEWSMPDGSLYGDYLFHGPRFQVIDRLISIHKAGGAGQLLQARVEAGEFIVPALTSPMLLDGGLQLVRLWGCKFYSRTSLPMRIGRCIMYSTLIAEEPIQCQFTIVKQSPSKLVADIYWTNGQGLCWAHMEQVEMYFVDERRPV